MEKRSIWKVLLMMPIIYGYLTVAAQAQSCTHSCTTCSSTCSSQVHADNEEELEALNKEISSGNNLATAYDNRGLYYFKTSKYKLAIKDFNQALTYDSTRCEIYNHLGIVYYFLKDYLTALEYYDKSLTIDPSYAKAYFNRGIVKIKIEDEEGGFHDIKRASYLKNSSATKFLSENFNAFRPFGI